MVLGGAGLIFGILSGVMGLLDKSGSLTSSIAGFAMASFAAVWGSAVFFVLDLHLHLDLIRIELEEEVQPTLLNRFYNKEFHHYHLSEDDEGKYVWIYKKLIFDTKRPNGTLAACAPIKTTTEERRENYLYDFEASIVGGNLILLSHLAGDTDVGQDIDVGVDLFLDIGNQDVPAKMCGARIITTYKRNEATTIALLSLAPLAGSDKEGPLSHEIGAELEAVWEKNSKMIRLPLGISGEWDRDRYEGLINEVLAEKCDSTSKGHRGAGSSARAEDADLRIVVSYFRDWTYAKEKLTDLLEAGARIEVLFMNPANSGLLKARFELRNDFNLACVKRQCATQKKEANALPSLNPGWSGSISALASDAMPPGFYALTRSRVIMGIMLADRSFDQGPMLEGSRGSELWKRLDADWKVRWANAII
jgi:hypothetical protein